MLFTVQCIDEDLLNSPNAITPEEVDPDFLLNNIQMQTRSVYRSAASIGGQNTRMRYMFGDTYGNAWSPTSFNGIYNTAYASVLIDIKNLLEVTDVEADEEGLHFHRGIAKTLKAFTLMIIVDNFGDMPFSEALLGSERFNPELDTGESIYNAALDLLDEAIADFDNDNRLGMPSNDLFYGGTSTANRIDRWTRTANTLKLKAYLNTENVSGINAFDPADDLIVSNSHNFTFDYSTTDTNPDSRHPDFSNNYVDLASAYMAVNYLNMLLNDKNDWDPRIRYYFYRQTNEDPDDVNLNTCVNVFAPPHFDEDDPFCLLGDGWWGRDHLIDDGIPPDRGLRTTFGVYPAGGQFDANQSASVNEEMGMAGAGFDPILMASFTHFMLAEAVVRLGASGNAEDHLETAVRLSMAAVRNFGEPIAVAEVEAQIEAAIEAADDPTDEEIDDIREEWEALLISDDDIDDYVDVVLNRFNSDPLRTVAKEFYLALWPNGYEAYNLMRRTQFPDSDDHLQPARAPEPGDWYRSLLYPSNLVERNSNVDQKTNRLVGPFWDPHSGSDKFNF